jgi:hypothetical protein
MTWRERGGKVIAAPCRKVLRSLRRQRPDKLQCSLNPAIQLVVVLDTFQGDKHPVGPENLVGRQDRRQKGQ